MGEAEEAWSSWGLCLHQGVCKNRLLCLFGASARTHCFSFPWVQMITRHGTMHEPLIQWRRQNQSYNCLLADPGDKFVDFFVSWKTDLYDAQRGKLRGVCKGSVDSGVEKCHYYKPVLWIHAETLAKCHFAYTQDNSCLRALCARCTWNQMSFKVTACLIIDPPPPQPPPCLSCESGSTFFCRALTPAINEDTWIDWSHIHFTRHLVGRARESLVYLILPTATFINFAETKCQTVSALSARLYDYFAWYLFVNTQRDFPLWKHFGRRPLKYF